MRTDPSMIIKVTYDNNVFMPAQISLKYSIKYK